MTDKLIKRFQLNVQFKDGGDWLAKGGEILRGFVENLRDKGYVPVLDIDPYVSVKYDGAKETLNYTLTVQTVFVGKENAWKVEGLSNGKSIPMAIRKSK